MRKMGFFSSHPGLGKFSAEAGGFGHAVVAVAAADEAVGSSPADDAETIRSIQKLKTARDFGHATKTQELADQETRRIKPRERTDGKQIAASSAKFHGSGREV
jgi:hypothetical protein